MKKFRFELYDYFEKNKGKIFDELGKVPNEVGFSEQYKGNVGLSGGSGAPPLIMDEVSQAMEKASKKLIKVADLDTEVRRLVKSFYGDDYDGAIINTCEAALWVAFDALFSPPLMGRGDVYRAKYIAPYERHIHHQAGYGRPFPPQYKDLSADRGATAGEMGVYAKRLNNLETVMVPLEGADYTCHGIKNHPCTLMLNVDSKKSIEELNKFSEIHSSYLAGISSMGYDTPGYGYGEKDENGAPLLQKGLGAIASKYNVPYLIDNARGTPFLGTDIRKINADLMVISTDKAFPGPTAGLIIGKEEKMVQIRRAIGIHGMRWGTGSSHAKAGYVAFDPGKEIVSGMIKMLEILLEKPEKVTKSVDQMYDIAVEEFSGISPEIKEGLEINKSYNSLGIEINYERTWNNTKGIIPIFSIEDMYAGTNIIQGAMKRMGINPPLGYDANIPIGPNVGTTDIEGNLIEEPSRKAIRCLVKTLEILNKHSQKALN